MELLLISIGILFATGLLSSLLAKRKRLAARIAIAGVLVAGILGFLSAVLLLTHARTISLQPAWGFPIDHLELALDPLAAFFLIPVTILSALTAVYGEKYLDHGERSDLSKHQWFFFNLLVAAMILVLIAANTLVFLICWEVMSLASFFLVIHDPHSSTGRRAGIIYLSATHLGVACLLLFFILLGQENGGTMSFARFATPAGSALTSLLFALVFVGFGSKAGFVPFHIWLPEAHPAAPAHVSALMSGVMIKMGLYGILRTISFLGPPPLWWGMLLLIGGAVSGLFGILFALGQKEIKRLLAFSSIENVGIINMALGLAMLGLGLRQPPLAVLGFAGALLHILNHSFFKGLLFLGAGAIDRAADTLSLDELGGLQKKMPLTGSLFLLAALAISGLPPFNGFFSEFFIYLAALQGILTSDVATVLPGVIVLLSLALIGALALACFAGAYGVSFLGEGRTSRVNGASDPARSMLLPMIILAVGCIFLGLFAGEIALFFTPVLSGLTGYADSQVQDVLRQTMSSLNGIVLVLLVMGGVFVLLWAGRTLLFSRRSVRRGVTWDCGYGTPGPRLQYTQLSFSGSIIDFFSILIRPERATHLAETYFPDRGNHHFVLRDLFLFGFFAPVFHRIEKLFLRLRWLQSGGVHRYIFYIAFTLVLLLVLWSFGLLGGKV